MLCLKLVRNTQLLSGEKLETLKHCQRRQQFTDVVFICEGKFYFAHKLILASMSTKCRYLILEQNHNEVANIFLNGVKSHDLENLICLLYSGEIWLPRNEIPGLMKVSSSLGIDQFEAHPEVEIPEKLLYGRASNHSKQSKPFQTSRNNSRNSPSSKINRTNVPRVSKNDQENIAGPSRRVVSSSSNYVSFSDSTLPSSITSSECLTKIGNKTSGKTAKNIKKKYSFDETLPENLRHDDPDLLNMNLFAFEGDGDHIQNLESQDFTFAIDARNKTKTNGRKAKGQKSTFFNSADSSASSGNSFPAATSIWDVSIPSDTESETSESDISSSASDISEVGSGIYTISEISDTGSDISDADSEISDAPTSGSKLVKSKKASSGKQKEIVSGLKAPGTQKEKTVPISATVASAPIIEPTQRVARAAKLKALDAIQTRRGGK